MGCEVTMGFDGDADMREGIAMEMKQWVLSWWLGRVGSIWVYDVITGFLLGLCL